MEKDKITRHFATLFEQNRSIKQDIVDLKVDFKKDIGELKTDIKELNAFKLKVVGGGIVIGAICTAVFGYFKEMMHK